MKKRLFNKKMEELRQARKEQDKETIKELVKELQKIKKYL